MKKISLSLFAVSLAVLCAVKASASGVGFINYQKVQENYPFAIQAVKEVDAKGLEIQQFMVDKEKQYKSLDTPLKRQNFEDVTARELKAKEDAFMRLKTQKEEQIYNKIQAATKEVMVEQKLDAVLDFRVIFVGGLDISNLVIDKLKTKQY